MSSETQMRHYRLTRLDRRATRQEVRSAVGHELRRVKPEPAPAPRLAPLPPVAIDAYEGLPALMIETAEVAGLEAAVALFRARGGNRVYIPAKAGDGHWLVQLVGRDAADRLIAHFSTDGAGCELELPRGPTGARAEQWHRLHQMIRDGASSTAITRALGISRDMVKRHRAKLRDEAGSNQLSLLDLIPLPKPGRAIND